MADRSLVPERLISIARIGGFQSGMDQAARVADTRACKIESRMRGSRQKPRPCVRAYRWRAGHQEDHPAINEQEQAVAQVEAAIRSTGGSAGYIARELQDMASELQKVTIYGDEAILSMQSLLLPFHPIQGDIFKDTTTAVLDLATRMGIDLKLPCC